MDNTQRDLFFDAEAQLLGSLFIAGSAGDLEPINAVSQIITAEDFLPYRDKLHQRIYQGMLDSPRTDNISVATTMHQRGTLQKEDLSYMSYLCSIAIGIDCEYFAQLVAANALQWRDGQVKARFTGEI